MNSVFCFLDISVLFLSVLFLQRKIWNPLPSDLQSIDNFENSKKAIKNGKLRAVHNGCAKYIYIILVFCRERKLVSFH